MNGQIEVELQDWMGSDRSIAEAAWTSTYDIAKRERRSDEDVAALVPRLIRDGHSTPVESVVLRFWLRIPIFTDRQHMTHRIASHNGLSGRYRTMPEDWYGLPDDCRAIVDKIDYQMGSRMARDYDRVCMAAQAAYKSWIDCLKKAETAQIITNSEYKRVRELVRGVLPVAGMVERVTVMNLRSFANYQRLRNSDHAQPEIRFVATEMLRHVEHKAVAPLAVATLKEVGWRI